MGAAEHSRAVQAPPSCQWREVSPWKRPSVWSKATRPAWKRTPRPPHGERPSAHECGQTADDRGSGPLRQAPRRPAVRYFRRQVAAFARTATRARTFGSGTSGLLASIVGSWGRPTPPVPPGSLPVPAALSTTLAGAISWSQSATVPGWRPREASDRRTRVPRRRLSRTDDSARVRDAAREPPVEARRETRARCAQLLRAFGRRRDRIDDDFP